MKAYLTRRYGFSASHRLDSGRYSPEENQRVYGKCNHPHGHGHNYFVEITVSGTVDPVTGMVCDLGALDEAIGRDIISRFDEMNLNLDPAFKSVVPTTENLCVEIYRVVRSSFTQATLERVRVEETGKNSFEFAG